MIKAKYNVLLIQLSITRWIISGLPKLLAVYNVSVSLCRQVRGACIWCVQWYSLSSRCHMLQVWWSAANTHW